MTSDSISPNSSETQEAVRCERITHASGIEELILKEVSQRAVDEWFVHLTDIMRATENGATIRILVDTTVGMMPLQYASRRGREWMQAMSRERRDSELKSRLAFLYDRGFLISLVGNMIRLLMRGIQNGYELRFFDKAHREDAMAWLLED